MAQSLRALTVLTTEDTHLVLSTHIRWLTNAYNSSSVEFGALSPPMATTPCAHSHIQTQGHTHAHTAKNKRKPCFKKTFFLWVKKITVT